MLITPKEYKAHFHRYYIIGCAIRNSNTFDFIVDRFYSDEEVEQEEAENRDPALRDKRIVSFLRHEEPGKQWSHIDMLRWEYLYCSTAKYPSEYFLGSDLEGQVYFLDRNSSVKEDNIPLFLGENGPDRGGIYKLKNIGGHLYFCGGARSIGKRLGRNKWFSHTHNIPYDIDSMKIGHAGFNDIDGFNENDMYAVGGYGDVWHFDGNIWSQIVFPTNQPIQTVCCGHDGLVYISCYEGLTFVGRNNSWTKIFNGGISLGFRDMVWFEDRVWCTSDYGIWTIHNNKLQEQALPSEVRSCSGYLQANDNILLVAGMGGAAFLENNKWQPILLPFELSKEIDN